MVVRPKKSLRDIKENYSYFCTLDGVEWRYDPKRLLKLLKLITTENYYLKEL